ncbi:hypothetical protein Kpho02_24490 [Kitasatospora phosalacinea]|uniref:Uncharacterized protein n=1 Tax=Kitasatospora phosalacinea TaxID=2065 RepID=A0A9W6Q574_9ACTN|nr:hypothetical protein [Kitasatospora phosalacinea]GLW70150.1 hypothetical protein Kpho02_24490 [Kitasatospora phosalacinea]
MRTNGLTAKRAAVVLAATLAIGGGIGVTSASAASAPSCVSYYSTSSWVTNTTRATNNCSYDVRIRFDWSNHVDGPCTTIAAYGGWHSETVAITASFQGAYTC